MHPAWTGNAYHAPCTSDASCCQQRRQWGRHRHHEAYRSSHQPGGPYAAADCGRGDGRGECDAMHQGFSSTKYMYHPVLAKHSLWGSPLVVHPRSRGVVAVSSCSGYVCPKHSSGAAVSAGPTAGDRPLQQRAVVRRRHCMPCPHLDQYLNENSCCLPLTTHCTCTTRFVCAYLPCAPWSRCKRAAALRRGEPEPPGSTPATPVSTGEEQTSPQKPGRKAKLLSPRVRCCSRTHCSSLTIAVSWRGTSEAVLLGTDVRG